MGIGEEPKYLRTMKGRYQQADKKTKRQGLDEMQAVTGKHRNLFQPVMHLVEKETIREEGQTTRVRRRHDEARTPFDRLCKTKAILPAHNEQLAALRDSINPRRLRSEIYDDIDAILKLPCAETGSTQDVHMTPGKNHDNGKTSYSLSRAERAP